MTKIAFQSAAATVFRAGLPGETQLSRPFRPRYRAPYDWENILAFLQARAIPGMEVVEDGRYLRTVEIDGALGSVSVVHLPKKQSLEVSILFPDVRALPAIVARVRRQLAERP